MEKHGCLPEIPNVIIPNVIIPKKTETATNARFINAYGFIAPIDLPRN